MTTRKKASQRELDSAARSLLTAANVLMGMAYDRDTFVEKIRVKVFASAHHFVSARLCALNGTKSHLVTKWAKEIDGWLDIELPVLLIHELTISDKARVLAAEQALARVRDDPETVKLIIRTGAEHWARSFGVKKPKKPFTPVMLEPLWERVEGKTEETIGHMRMKKKPSRPS